MLLRLLHRTTESKWTCEITEIR